MNIEPIARTVNGVAEGQPFPAISMEAIDAENAARAREHAGRTKAETIALIKGSVGGAVEIVRSLSDDQLDRKIQPIPTMPEMTLEQVVQMVIIGHVGYHLGTITGGPVTD